MKKAIIIAHGNKPAESVLSRYIGKNDLVICADGGADYAVAAGIMPHVVIGDNDSVSKTLKTKLKKYTIEWISYPQHPKYQTDAELAVQHALNKKFRKIVVFGVYGSRVDQTLATLLYLAKVQQYDGQFRIIEDEQEVSIITKKIEIDGKKDDVFSLIPLEKDATGVTITGARYQLKNATIPYGSTLGISNEFTQKNISVSLTNGILMLIHTKT